MLMDFTLELLNRLLQALVHLLIHPFYYLGILLIVLQYRRQIALERKLFHTKLHSLLGESWRMLLWGWIGGLAVSVVMAGLGVALEPASVLWIWGVTLLLLLLRVRYLCLAYAAGLVGTLHGAAALVPGLAETTGAIGAVIQPLLSLEVPSLLALVAVLHLLEGLLLRWQGARLAVPLFVEGKRGKIVGGYDLQSFLPVPLFLLVPVGGEAGASAAMPWTPFFAQELWGGGWTVVAFPVVIGFAALTVTKLPALKARWTSNGLLIYGAAVLLLAVSAELWSLLLIPACLLTIALHEGLIWVGNWRESGQAPLFVHDQRGMMVLGVLPGSAAAELGIRPGEKIHKVNGVRVGTKEELHQALRMNAAFCKLEILNGDGESKFMRRAMFSNEHHQLGIILAPDDKAMYYVKPAPVHVFAYLRSKLTGLSGRSGPKKDRDMQA